MDLDPKAETIQVPKLIIQPLAENAVIHGVEKSPLPVSITLVTRLHDDELEIRVEDTGPGPGLHTAALEGHGMGLSNVEKRLRLIYGEGAAFTLFREPGKTIARVRISQ
jgi:sensor histidine kinase YesM